MRKHKEDYSTIDTYLKEIFPNAKSMNEVVRGISEKLDVCVSSVQRWRSMDSVPKAEDIIDIIMEVNKVRPDDKKCTLKDVAILCNYKGKFRKK